jgi:small subunit ribosomal protein S6
MPVNNYECLFLLDSAKASGGNLDAARAQLHGTLEKYGAEILASRPWDDRRLAYPIKGHKKGLYYLIFFRSDSLKITEMEHDFRISELILRHMVSAIDAKWVDEMLEVARDDHRFAYQAMREEAPEGGPATPTGGPGPGPEGGGDMEGGDRGGPRRRPRPAETAEAKD